MHMGNHHSNHYLNAIHYIYSLHLFFASLGFLKVMLTSAAVVLLIGQEILDCFNSFSRDQGNPAPACGTTPALMVLV